MPDYGIFDVHENSSSSYPYHLYHISYMDYMDMIWTIWYSAYHIHIIHITDMDRKMTNFHARQIYRNRAYNMSYRCPLIIQELHFFKDIFSADKFFICHKEVTPINERIDSTVWKYCQWRLNRYCELSGSEFH